MEQEYDVVIRDPAGTMKNMEIARRIIRSAEEDKSGTVQPDNDLTPAMDK